MSIKIRVRDLRLARGLTQVQLAERCGMPQSTISRIESGTTSGVDFETLDKIAAALEVHPSDLISFGEVTFDYNGRSFVVTDITAEVEEMPTEATAVWRIRGTDLTFGTGPGTNDAAAVIAHAKQVMARGL